MSLKTKNLKNFKDLEYYYSSFINLLNTYGEKILKFSFIILIFVLLTYLVLDSYDISVRDFSVKRKPQLLFERHTKTIYYLEKNTKETKELYTKSTSYPSSWYWKPGYNFLDLQSNVYELDKPSWELNRGSNSPLLSHKRLGLYRYLYHNQTEKTRKRYNSLDLKKLDFFVRRIQEDYADEFFKTTESRIPFFKYDKIFEYGPYVIYRSPALKYNEPLALKKIPHFKTFAFGNIRSLSEVIKSSYIWKISDKKIFSRGPFKTAISKVSPIYSNLRRWVYKTFHMQDTRLIDSKVTFYADDLRLNDASFMPFKYTYLIINKNSIRKQNNITSSRILKETNEHMKYDLFLKKTEPSYRSQPVSFCYDCTPIPYNLVLVSPYHDLKVPLFQYKLKKKEVLRTERYMLRLAQEELRLYFRNLGIGFLLFLITLLLVLKIFEQVLKWYNYLLSSVGRK